MLERGELLEEARDLEGARDAEVRDLIRAKVCRVAPEDEDLAARWFEKTGKEVEQTRLARTVRANEGVDAARFEPNIDAVHGAEPPEFLAPAARLDSKSVLACAARAAYGASLREVRLR